MRNNPSRLGWVVVVPVLVLCFGCVARQTAEQNIAVHGRWHDISMSGLARLSTGRRALFTLWSLASDGAQCEVSVKVGAQGFGQGRALCQRSSASKPVTLEVEAWYQQAHNSMTLLIKTP